MPLWPLLGVFSCALGWADPPLAPPPSGGGPPGDGPPSGGDLGPGRASEPPHRLLCM